MPVSVSKVLSTAGFTSGSLVDFCLGERMFGEVWLVPTTCKCSLSVCELSRAEVFKVIFILLVRLSVMTSMGEVSVFWRAEFETKWSLTGMLACLIVRGRTCSFMAVERYVTIGLNVFWETLNWLISWWSCWWDLVTCREFWRDLGSIQSLERVKSGLLIGNTGFNLF